MTLSKHLFPPKETGRRETPPSNSASVGIGLSGKLLALTVLFILIAEILIYVPSISNFRVNRLNDHLASAQTAALVLDAAPDGAVPKLLEQQILQQIGAQAITLKRGNARRLLAFSDMPPEVAASFDLRDALAIEKIIDAFSVLLGNGDRIIRLIGPAPSEGEFVEIIMSELPLRQAMLQFSLNIFLLSLAISAIVGSLVYLALLAMFVRPMRALSAKMMRFREAPEVVDGVIAPSHRHDEIGVAEHELQRLQKQVQSALAQKNHLAALGLAVSKISHDLRNILTSAQLFSDHLASVPDPTVQRMVPRVIGAIDRAIMLCQTTLAYGRAAEPAPMPRRFKLKRTIDDVGIALGFDDNYPKWINTVSPDFLIYADPDQLYRAFLNLGRNALEALRQSKPDAGTITISARKEGGDFLVTIVDNGPGIPYAVRQRLFQPFSSSSGRGGSGLGLAIVAELVRAHGGEIKLLATEVGTSFQLSLPEGPRDS